MKSIEEIKEAFFRVHRLAVGGANVAPYMSIPADPDRDADLIVSAAIDELSAARARIAELEQIRDFLQRANGERLEEARSARALMEQFRGAISAAYVPIGALLLTTRREIASGQTPWLAPEVIRGLEEAEAVLVPAMVAALATFSKADPRRTHSSEGRPFFDPSTTYEEMLSGKSPDPRETQEAAGNRSDKPDPAASSSEPKVTP